MLMNYSLRDGPREPQCTELEDQDCKKDQLPANSEIVQDQLNPYKSMRPDVIHLQTLKELADVITKPLSVIFDWSWESREVLDDWNLVNAVQIFKGKKENPGNQLT
ncbi:RNA-directed DNA polymerase from mobile element jockey [Willisornis vidua]|uniref:RNA-directed DNA polymerase from mobile element jockey n=1 Tax=Willisornis vidua TaxID=1566151 RepID=A0ABQ9DB95_9PASS|nr:RNA-directed DNA polymerase from mobile element jockey [Willisornis vidua]